MIAAVLVCLMALFVQDPRAVGAYDRANALFVEKKFPECLEAIEEALQFDPKLVPALTLRAKLAMAMNRFDVARQSLERAIALDPASQYAHFLLGFQHYLQNDLQQALAALEKARELNPKDGRALLYLGLTQESLGDSGKAVESYQQAMRIEEAAGKPQTETLLIYARLLLLLERFEECAKIIDRAVRLDPNNREARFERVRLLLKKGDPAGAAREGETALRLPAAGVTDEQVRYLLVRAYSLAGREEQAAAHASALRKPGR
jgi:tetratricopeptide (TPR) repeat protein